MRFALFLILFPCSIPTSDKISVQARLGVARLCRALYGRTVATIVKKVNSTKCRGGEGQKWRSSKEMVGSGFVGVCDLWGFQDSKPNGLEQMCINLSSETLQHFYQTFTLKTARGGDCDRSHSQEIIQLMTSQVCGVWSL